jgi:kinesin family protein 6/9
MADTSGIQVYLRIRPTTNTLTYFHRDDIDLKSITVKVPKNDDTVNNSRTAYNFSFTGILDDKVSQREVFRCVGIPAIQNALAGFNSTIFAYGQTGSGKTFTITGGPEKYEDRGLIPRALSHLFKAIKDDAQSSYSCYISYLEIYNQSGYDLLMQNNNSNAAFEEVPKVSMLEDEYGNFHFKNLSLQTVTSEEDALNLLFLGDTNRAIAATEMNQNSTRSHCIFTILMEKRMAGADTVIRSKLNIVDLAGSERVSRTSSVGQTLKEAKYINSSLFFLEMVIVALHEKDSRDNVHIPYRNSMMTSVLRDSLGGNCKTTMIATISPEAQYTDESVSTCHFAQRVALVKNSASVNEVVDPDLVIQRLRNEVKRLRDEVEFLSGKSNDDEGSGEEKPNRELTPQQISELTESINKYVQDRGTNSHLDFCGGITLPRIRAVCSIFKEMLLRKPNVIANDESQSDGDEESVEKYEKIAASNKGRSGNAREDDINKTQAPKSSENDVRGSRSIVSSVCGVPLCRDKRVIAEPNLAFTFFKDRYPGSSTIDENKSTLKTKIAEAKDTGKTVEEIRSRINEHKTAIEKVRVLSDREGDRSESVEEKLHRDAIHLEKAAYNNALDRLGGLKITIENLQKLVETKRLKMQADFDMWYRQACSEQSRSNDEAEPILSTAAIGESSKETTTNLRKLSLPIEEGRERVISQHEEQKLPNVEPQKEFKLPPGVKLTGNPQVDDDIIAFFKAKEVLLSKCKR